MNGGPTASAWPYRSGPARALGLRFSVRSTCPAIGPTIDSLLAALADGAPDGIAVEYALVESDGSDGRGSDRRGFTVHAGDEVVGQAATAHDAVSLLLWDVNRRAVASTPDYLLLHAAAVAHRGRGILLPGPSGAGKTTLSASLVRSGMTYLTDEVAAIDPATQELVPYPKPLTVERGSWAALAELGIVDDGGCRADEPTWHLAPSRLRAGAAEGEAGAAERRCRPRYVVVHRYAPGEATSLVPLRGSAALVVLAESSFQPLHLRPGGLEVLADVVRESECLELTVGDLGEACRTLIAHLDRSRAEATQ